MKLVGLIVALGMVASGCAGVPTEDEAAPTQPTTTASGWVCPETAAQYPNSTVQVDVTTSKGSFSMLMAGGRSPITVCNFLSYVDDAFYDGTTFHRICQGFVIQAGGVQADGTQRARREPIVNEARDSGLNNSVRTVAMGRTGDPDSATSHWYVNLKDNDHLNPGGADEWGYAVFGQVTQGWDVVLAIADTPVIPSPEGCQGMPVPTNEVAIASIAVDR